MRSEQAPGHWQEGRQRQAHTLAVVGGQPLLATSLPFPQVPDCEGPGVPELDSLYTIFLGVESVMETWPHEMPQLSPRRLRGVHVMLKTDGRGC